MGHRPHSDSGPDFGSRPARSDETPDDRRRAVPGASDPLNTDNLGETKVDLDAQDDGDEAPDVDLNEVYDRPPPQRTEDASLRRFDPEAGKMGLGVRIRAVRQRIDTPFGRFVIAFPLNLAALSLGIYTVAFPNWPLIVASALVIPACGWLLWWRYQQWLGHKRYMYRLLETLGEDVSDWNMDQTFRKPKVRRARR